MWKLHCGGPINNRGKNRERKGPPLAVDGALPAACLPTHLSDGQADCFYSLTSSFKGKKTQRRKRN